MLSPFISRAVYLTLISSLDDLSALKIDHKDPYSGIWARPFEGAKMVFRSQGGFFGTFSALLKKVIGLLNVFQNRIAIFYCGRTRA